MQILFFGGERGVRTLAPITRPNSLANCPLHHLGISPNCIYKIIKKPQKIVYDNFSTFFFGGEGGIRTHGRLQTYANFQDWCHKPTRPPLQLFLTFINNSLYTNIFFSCLSIVFYYFFYFLIFRLFSHSYPKNLLLKQLFLFTYIHKLELK